MVIWLGETKSGTMIIKNLIRLSLSFLMKISNIFLSTFESFKILNFILKSVQKINISFSCTLTGCIFSKAGKVRSVDQTSMFNKTSGLYKRDFSLLSWFVDSGSIVCLCKVSDSSRRLIFCPFRGRQIDQKHNPFNKQSSMINSTST